MPLFSATLPKTCLAPTASPAMSSGAGSGAGSVTLGMQDIITDMVGGLGTGVIDWAALGCGCDGTATIMAVGRVGGAGGGLGVMAAAGTAACGFRWASAIRVCN